MATPSKKPLSIKEIRKIKDNRRKTELNKLRIYNISKLQVINIQMYGKNSKLVPYQQSIQIAPGKHVDLPTSRLISEQIDNLRKSGFITTMKVDSSKQIASSDLLSQISKTVKPNKLKILKK